MPDDVDERVTTPALVILIGVLERALAHEIIGFIGPIIGGRARRRELAVDR